MASGMPENRDKAMTTAPACATHVRPAAPVGAGHVVRFDLFDRILHGFLIVSFFGLSATGLPLLFGGEDWAQGLARGFGGVEAAGVLHRLSAALLIMVFAAHLIRVGRRVIVGKDYTVFWGPDSMVPQPRDVVELVQHLRWFLGGRTRPRFGRYTYWEKFDYMAVFWGMAIIGGSGLLLWFPELFARLLPGWIFNVALLVHGEEALLAVGFIFTIHFFNTHLRPEKFPVDRVIFTGCVSEAEWRDERPAEVDRVEGAARLEVIRVAPPEEWLIRLAHAVAGAALVIGLTLVGLILYGVFF